jgi:hypothetical protein
MTQESSQFERRHDRDLREGIVPGQDSRDEQMRKLKEHLRRPITAAEANGKVPLHSGALRAYADLDAIPEHPFIKGLRELREARENK